MSPTACETEEAAVKVVAGMNDSVNASFPIRWALNPAAFKVLAENGVTQPNVLIVIAGRVPICGTGTNCWMYEELSRELVPANPPLRFCTFRRSGVYRVFVQFVWGDGKDHVPDAIYLACNFRNKWARPLVNAEGELYNVDYPFALRTCSAIDIVVDSGFFAPAPPSWWRTWANYGFSEKPSDECNFRKRVIWAFTGKPICVLLWWAMKIVFRLALGIGAFLAGFYVHWPVIFRPWGASVRQVWGCPARNIFLFRKDGSERPFYMLGLLPVWFVLALGFAWQAKDLFNLGVSVLSIGLLGYFGLFVVALAGWALIAYPAMRWWESRSALRDVAAQKKCEKLRLREVECRERELEALRVAIVADGQTRLGTAVKDLPKPKVRQIIVLRAQEIIARVCRPYEQK